MLDMSVDAEADVSNHLIANALVDCASALDGFGREQCRVHSTKATSASKAEKISFQNLDGARDNVKALFNFDISAGLAADEWDAVVRGFQKRHLVSHKMGVVDDEYVRKTKDSKAVIGRKVIIEADEIRELVAILGKLGQSISVEFARHT